MFIDPVGSDDALVAVEMIFYPIEYFGVALRRWVNQPLGVVGWQGIVPFKRVKFALKATHRSSRWK